jgi:hypothetical protein
MDSIMEQKMTLRELSLCYQAQRDSRVKPEHLFNVDRDDLYEHDKPRDRTRARLMEMADLGMEETGSWCFGYRGATGGLYIEMVWEKSDEDFKDYMDWAREMIAKHKEND